MIPRSAASLQLPKCHTVSRIASHSPYNKDMKNIQRHGMFITTADPSPTMLTVMEKIQRQMQAEHEYRQAVRAGKIQPEQFTNWNISDRH